MLQLKPEYLNEIFQLPRLMTGVVGQLQDPFYVPYKSGRQTKKRQSNKTEDDE